MRTLTISVVPDMEDDMAQFVERAERGIATGQYQGEHLTFPSAELLFSEITPTRWKLVDCLLGNGTLGVRELAQKLHRDVQPVGADADLLVELGLIEKTRSGALHCPYGRIHFDVELTAPAATGLKQAA